VIGGVCGASSATSYVESAAGVAEGARTGLHSVFVGLLFLASMVLAPLAAAVPAVATAPALILTGLLMCRDIGRIDVARLDTALPAFLTVIMVPLTYSISHWHRRRLRLPTSPSSQALSGRVSVRCTSLMASAPRPSSVFFCAALSWASCVPSARYFCTPKRNTVCDR
jgi:hypothetical protein